MSERTHLSAEDIAGYVDRHLAAARIPSVEQHLSTCAACRQDLIAARRLSPSTSARRWAVRIGVALAAGLAFVLPFVPRPAEPGPLGELEREAISPVAPRIRIAVPAENAVIARQALTFAWQGTGAPAAYRVTITDATGTRAWTGETADTHISLGTDVVLSSGRPYFWFVDALLPDGRSLTSGTHRFTIAP